MALLEAISLWEVVLTALLVLLAWGLIAPRRQLARRKKRRRQLVKALGHAEGTRVLTLVHGKTPASLLGRPSYEMIDLDDAQEVLRGIRKALRDQPVDLVLHTPGGIYPAALQIARALHHHPARTRVFVPHLAMSGGTLIALAADEIVADPDAIFGPVDPQVGDLLRGRHSVASWMQVAERKGADADDATLAFADVSRKLLEGTRQQVRELVAGKVADPEPLLARLVEGGYAHAYPVSPAELQNLGVTVRTDLPPQVHELLATYRAPGGRDATGA